MPLPVRCRHLFLSLISLLALCWLTLPALGQPQRLSEHALTAAADALQIGLAADAAATKPDKPSFFKQLLGTLGFANPNGNQDVYWSMATLGGTPWQVRHSQLQLAITQEELRGLLEARLSELARLDASKATGVAATIRDDGAAARTLAAVGASALAGGNQAGALTALTAAGERAAQSGNAEARLATSQALSACALALRTTAPEKLTALAVMAGKALPDKLPAGTPDSVFELPLAYHDACLYFASPDVVKETLPKQVEEESRLRMALLVSALVAGAEVAPTPVTGSLDAWERLGRACSESALEARVREVCADILPGLLPQTPLAQTVLAFCSTDETACILDACITGSHLPKNLELATDFPQVVSEHFGLALTDCLNSAKYSYYEAASGDGWMSHPFNPVWMTYADQLESLVEDWSLVVQALSAMDRDKGRAAVEAATHPALKAAGYATLMGLAEAPEDWTDLERQLVAAWAEYPLPGKSSADWIPGEAKRLARSSVALAVARLAARAGSGESGQVLTGTRYEFQGFRELVQLLVGTHPEAAAKSITYCGEPLLKTGAERALAVARVFGDPLGAANSFLAAAAVEPKVLKGVKNDYFAYAFRCDQERGPEQVAFANDLSAVLQSLFASQPGAASQVVAGLADPYLRAEGLRVLALLTAATGGQGTTLLAESEQVVAEVKDKQLKQLALADLAAARVALQPGQTEAALQGITEPGAKAWALLRLASSPGTAGADRGAHYLDQAGALLPSIKPDSQRAALAYQVADRWLVGPEAGSELAIVGVSW